MGLVNPFPEWPIELPRDGEWKRPRWPMLQDVREVSLLIGEEPHKKLR